MSQEAHAGCLSFELSWKQHRLVVNCGLPAVNKETWRQVARATAAHSTVTFNDKSSCHFLESGSFRRLLSGTPIVGGPRDVRVEREDTPPARCCAPRMTATPATSASSITARIQLGADGRDARRRGQVSRRPTAAAFARAPATNSPSAFHLHPAIKASRLSDGRGVILLLPDREVWTFATYGDAVEIEESVFLAGSDGPRRAVQIVIYGHAREHARVREMELRPYPAGGARHPPGPGGRAGIAAVNGSGGCAGHSGCHRECTFARG